MPPSALSALPLCRYKLLDKCLMNFTYLFKVQHEPINEAREAWAKQLFCYNILGFQQNFVSKNAAIETDVLLLLLDVGVSLNWYLLHDPQC